MDSPLQDQRMMPSFLAESSNHIWKKFGKSELKEKSKLSFG
jgi:hypothetical protein